MLLSPLIQVAEKTISGILFAVACSAAMFNFGNPVIFDPLIAVVLVIVALIFRRDRNLLSILAIVASLKIVEEVTWLLFDNTLQIKIPLYLFMLLLIPFFSDGGMKAYLFCFVGFAAITEIFWYWVDYPAPGIFWQVWVCFISAVARRAMSVRVSWVIDLTGRSDIDFLTLDRHLFNLFSVLLIFYSLITTEYYIRHILGLHQVTLLYYASSYFAGTTSAFAIYVIIVESIKQFKLQELNA